MYVVVESMRGGDQRKGIFRMAHRCVCNRKTVEQSLSVNEMIEWCERERWINLDSVWLKQHHSDHSEFILLPGFQLFMYFMNVSPRDDDYCETSHTREIVPCLESPFDRYS